MDWTSIYETDGDDADPTFPFLISISLKRLVSFAEERFDTGYDKRAAYIFTINYILGVGCLGIPYSFSRSGIIFGSSIIVGVSTLAYATVCWVAESVSRAELLAKMPCEAGSKCWLCLGKHDADGRHINDVHSHAPGCGHLSTTPGSSLKPPPQSISIYSPLMSSSRDSKTPSAEKGKQQLSAGKRDSLTQDPGLSNPRGALHHYDTFAEGGGYYPGKNEEEDEEEFRGGAVSSSFFRATSLDDDEYFGLNQSAKKASGKKKPKSSPIIKQQRRPRSDTETSTHSEVDWSSEKSYEVTELCKKFLGNIHGRIYQVSLLGLMFVGLLAYSQVFANSVVALLEKRGSSEDTAASPTELWGMNEMQSRSLLALTFGLVVVPLSCFDLEEQVTVQAAMAIARFAAIFVMIGGSIAALFLDSGGNDTAKTSPPYFAEEHTDQMSYTFMFSGFGVMFSTALFSQLFQHSVPGLIRPLPPSQKQDVKSIFFFALLTTASLYLMLGVAASSYFGAETQSSVNLNFNGFYYGLDPDTASKFQLFMCSAFSNIVVLFPALDTLSVFPLIANTLGNNLAASSPKLIALIADHLKNREGQRELEARDRSEKSKRRTRAQNLTVMLWRVVAALPPIIFSVFASDLALSLQLAGVCGLYVAFVCPSLLQIESRKSVTRVLGEDNVETIYSGWHSAIGWCYVVLAFAAFSLVVVVQQIVEAWQEKYSS